MADLSRSEFMNRVFRLVTERFPQLQLQRSDERFSININGNWASLESLYRAMAARSGDIDFDSDIERWINDLLRAAQMSPGPSADLDQLRHRILPMILSAAPRDVSGLPMLTNPVLEGLTVSYAIDSERTVAYVPQTVFDKWSITLDQLHEIALANLVGRSQSLAAHAAQDESGHVSLVLIQVLDGYDASRILLPELHDRLRPHLGSPFLAGIPNRDVLICFRDTPEMIRRIERQVTEDYHTMPHQITDRLFLITPDGIAPYTPPDAD